MAQRPEEGPAIINFNIPPAEGISGFTGHGYFRGRAIGPDDHITLEDMYRDVLRVRLQRGSQRLPSEKGWRADERSKPSRISLISKP